MTKSQALLCTAFSLACTKAATPPPAAAPVAAPTPVPAAAQGAMAGTVLETMDAASYTYLKINSSGAEIWAAIPATKLTVGSQVTLVNPNKMENFESKTLSRTFPVIYFASGVQGPGAPAAAPAAAAPAAAPAAPTAAHVDVVPAVAVKVEKAKGANAKTVSEIFAQKTQLKDKPVVLHAKVVKYNGGIMGKNWLHLQDGSGAAANADHDLTVTSMAEANVGDVVTVEGAVHLDKDFGSGYSYGVIIEDAKITK